MRSSCIPGRQQAFIVADLGFGDSGKGLVTDYLVGEHDAEAVLRWNGGAQAGHNVVTVDGRHHCFSQFGAGSFHPRALTLHTRDVVVHPTALQVEAAHLAAQGVPDPMSRLHLHAASRVITPVHQAVGRLRELRRGEARHGSCGIGFGETVGDSISTPALVLRVGDLREPSRCRQILTRIRESKRALIAPWLSELGRSAAAAQELDLLESDEVLERWLSIAVEATAAASVIDDRGLSDLVARTGTLVLEGAQGMLLDEWHGLHPHTTWSDCRTVRAATELARLGYRGEVTRVGVVRSYLTRHGEGPLPTQAGALDVLREPHNSSKSWQGAFRRGWQDLALLRHAVRTGGALDVLVVTHLDAIQSLPELRLADGYRLADGGTLPDLDELCAEPPHGRRTEADQLAVMERVTDALGSARPMLESLPGSVDARGRALLARLGEATGAAQLWGAFGPTAADVKPLSPPGAEGSAGRGRRGRAWLAQYA